jgi:hypothetical protein
MSVANLGLGPPPGLGQTLWDRQICYRATDEGIHVLEQSQPPHCPGGDFPDGRGVAFQIRFAGMTVSWRVSEIRDTLDRGSRKRRLLRWGWVSLLVGFAPKLLG